MTRAPVGCTGALPEGERRPLRIAFACFFPDWGHVQPLLKIAKAAQDAGHTVRCYISSRSRGFAERSGLDAYCLQPPAMEEQGALARLARRSLFFLNFSGYSHTNLFVNPAVTKASLQELDPIVEDVRDFAPDLLVGDAHILGPMYEAIAAGVGARFVRHNASGTLAGRYRPFVRVYGAPVANAAWMRVVELAGAGFAKAFKAGFYLRHLDRWQASRGIKREASGRIAALKATTPPQDMAPSGFTTGLSWIEVNLLETPSAPEGVAAPTILPPLASPPEALAPDLENWLMGDPTPVVYVSFGSILALTEANYAAISRALTALPYRVVWSLPVGMSDRVEALRQDPRFFITSYVAQAELLKRAEVVGFVTHAGASSVQEALIGGTPLICVPLHADNGYISALVERLGVGKRLWKTELGSARFGATIAEVAADGEIQRRVAEISDRLAGVGAEGQVVSFLEAEAAHARRQEQPVLNVVSK